MIKVLFAAALVTAVHSWYTAACCGDRDCRPVPCDQIVETRDGWLYIPTRNKFTPEQVQPSQDRYCHVCLGQADGRSICAFIQTGA